MLQKIALQQAKGNDMKKIAFSVLAVSIATATMLPSVAGTNIFTGEATGTTTSTNKEVTASSNTAAKESGLGTTSSNANNSNVDSSPQTATDTNSQQLANQALQGISTSVTKAAEDCAENGLGKAVATGLAERQKEILALPTVSDMTKAAKENKNSLSVGCFTASTEVLNLSTLVPDLQNGLGSAIGRIVQGQINNMIQKTKDALMQQVCDVGNEMIAQAMKPINDQINKANQSIAGLSLESLVGSQIANSVGGDDKFSAILRDALSEVVSETDAELASRRDAYGKQIGYTPNYDPLAGLKASANQVYNNADTIAQNAVNNTQQAVGGALTGTTTTTTPAPTAAPTPATTATRSVAPTPAPSTLTAPPSTNSTSNANRFTGQTTASSKPNPFTNK